MSNARILVGDVRERLAELPDQSVQCVVTSPPYWGLRDYGHDGQFGLEQTPDEYVDGMVKVFAEVRRVLKDDGVLWLNLGDSYNGSGGAGGDYSPGGFKEGQPKYPGRKVSSLKTKDLVGVPWRVAFGLQEDGWYLRSDIIWHKPNPMPEAVKDRCTRSHEYVFMLTKQSKYFYDSDAIAEEASTAPGATWQERKAAGATAGNVIVGDGRRNGTQRVVHGKGVTSNLTRQDGKRNRRSVWTITTKPFKGAHFAVMPEALCEPPILASSRPGDLILDPFTGSGTVAVVALRHGRDFVGCELNPEYATIAETRITNDQPMLNEVSVES